MSTKHVRTAADLVRFGCGLKVECAACGNSQTFDGWAVARVSATGPFATFRRRLKCSRCGAREARMTVLSPPAPR